MSASCNCTSMLASEEGSIRCLHHAGQRLIPSAVYMKAYNYASCDISASSDKKMVKLLQDPDLVPVFPFEASTS